MSLRIGAVYDLILDRSARTSFYRAILKKFAADGTIVVNNPFWWSADDKFLTTCFRGSRGPEEDQ